MNDALLYTIACEYSLALGHEVFHGIYIKINKFERTWNKFIEINWKRIVLIFFFSEEYFSTYFIFFNYFFSIILIFIRNQRYFGLGSDREISGKIGASSRIYVSFQDLKNIRLHVIFLWYTIYYLCNFIIIRNLYNLLLYCIHTMYKRDQRKMNNKLSELIKYVR